MSESGLCERIEKDVTIEDLKEQGWKRVGFYADLEIYKNEKLGKSCLYDPKEEEFALGRHTYR